MEVKEKEHPLTLKVMRLTRPSLFSSISVTCDARDLPADLLNADLRQDMAIPSGLPYTGIGQVLLLPQSFGNIYLGEMFSCCLCVHNSSVSAIQQVNIKAVLQIGSERVALLGGETEVLLELQPDDVTSSTIQHEVKDVGTHILVCAVSYLAASGETLSFRKFYKFQVMKPVDIRTRFVNVQGSSDVLVEAAVENITSAPICLERVSMEPSPLYRVVALNSLHQDPPVDPSNPLNPSNPLDPSNPSKILNPSNPSTLSNPPNPLNPPNPSNPLFGPLNVVAPHETRQYLYRLTPSEGPTLTPSPEGSATLGKLDLVWRSNLGDSGRLQTSQFQRSAGAPPAEVVVKLLECPATVTLEQTFDVVLGVCNTGTRTLALRLEALPGAGSGSGCEWHCVVCRPLPPLLPGACHRLTLTALPLRTGIQRLCGVRLRDVTAPSVCHEVIGYGHVLVTPDSSESLDSLALTHHLQQLCVT
ncbi:trafficking protein particle complex subunit 13 [Hyalella azteca]|uniref:Trafficking protein particle complex subunit 13 n=1 Tax=Hyalella azteca TaxID=294128 RepID=A0A8B7PBA1_HYAAZ|nr:trafficking protein particle complex subunit 13 [Hyalella azteca]